MQRNVWSDIVSLANKTTQQLYKVSTPCTDDNHFNRRRRNEICGRIVYKYAPKLFWNVCIWHELVDLISYGLWISLQDRLQNGPRLVTNAWIDWYLMHSSHMWIQTVLLMWEILLSNVDWDCFRTLTLREILKIQNPLQEEHYVRFWKSYMCSNKLDV